METTKLNQYIKIKKSLPMDNKVVPGGWAYIKSITGDAVQLITTNAKPEKHLIVKLSQLDELIKIGTQQHKDWENEKASYYKTNMINVTDARKLSNKDIASMVYAIFSYKTDKYLDFEFNKIAKAYNLKDFGYLQLLEHVNNDDNLTLKIATVMSANNYIRAAIESAKSANTKAQKELAQNFVDTYNHLRNLLLS